MTEFYGISESRIKDTFTVLLKAGFDFPDGYEKDIENYIGLIWTLAYKKLFADAYWDGDDNLYYIQIYREDNLLIGRPTKLSDILFYLEDKDRDVILYNLDLFV